MATFFQNLNIRDRKLDLIYAISLLTRIPISSTILEPRPQSAWAWPVVGFGLGVLAGAAIWVLMALGAPNSVATIVGLAMMVLLTGCLHEDGLADTFDGLWGGQNAEQRLEIMRDSNIGAYGVTALVIAFFARFLGIFESIDDIHPIIVLTVSGALSRTVMMVAMHLCPTARNEGLAATTGRPPVKVALFGIIFSTILCIIFFGWQFLIPLIAVSIAGLLISLLAIRKIGGFSGDTLGASQQTSEIACLLAFTIIS